MSSDSGRFGRNRSIASRPTGINTFGRMIAPDARRIRDLRFQGQPVRPEQMFALATNSYRAAGGVGHGNRSPPDQA